MAIATVMAVIAGVTAASSAYGAHRAGGAADRAADRQQEQFDQQQQSEQERLDFFKQQYSDWQDMFNPVLLQLRTMAFEERDPDYESIAADVSSSFDVARGTERRTMARYGLSPADGQFGAGERQYGLSKATAHVDTRNNARMATRNDRFNRMSSFYGLGNGQQAGALQGINNSYGALASGAGGRASSYGNDARYFAGQSADNWQAFGSTDWQSIADGFI